MRKEYWIQRWKLSKIMNSLIAKYPQKTNINIMNNKIPSTAKTNISKVKKLFGKNSVISITPNSNIKGSENESKKMSLKGKHQIVNKRKRNVNTIEIKNYLKLK